MSTSKDDEYTARFPKVVDCLPSKLEIQDDSDARPSEALKPSVANPDIEISVRHKFAFRTTQYMTSFEYNMNHKHRGVAVIFNNLEFNETSLDKRRGTDKDVKALQEALPLLGFESDNIVVKNDLTKSEILYYSYQLYATKRTVFADCDCIAIFILTHGSEGNKIYARDDDYDLYKLIDQYLPNNFKELAGKPKLFFVNACRGQAPDEGVQLRSPQLHASKNDLLDNDHPKVYSHPMNADILISMSSTPGKASFRNEDGSWYIQDLCNAIKAYVNDNKLDTTDITELLTRIQYLVSQRKSSSKILRDNNKKQMPNFNSTLCRRLYFKTKK